MNFIQTPSRWTMMAIYKGEIEQHTEHRLIKDGIELRSQKWTAADNYEHFYFSWGNSGLGAHQLAMVILVEEGLSVEDARSLHHSFCLAFIAMLDSNTDWELNSNQFQKIIDMTIDADRKMGRT